MNVSMIAFMGAVVASGFFINGSGKSGILAQTKEGLVKQILVVLISQGMATHWELSLRISLLLMIGGIVFGTSAWLLARLNPHPTKDVHQRADLTNHQPHGIGPQLSHAQLMSDTLAAIRKRRSSEDSANEFTRIAQKEEPYRIDCIVPKASCLVEIDQDQSYTTEPDISPSNVEVNKSESCANSSAEENKTCAKEKPACMFNCNCRSIQRSGPSVLALVGDKDQSKEDEDCKNECMVFDYESALSLDMGSFAKSPCCGTVWRVLERKHCHLDVIIPLEDQQTSSRWKSQFTENTTSNVASEVIEEESDSYEAASYTTPEKWNNITSKDTVTSRQQLISGPSMDEIPLDTPVGQLLLDHGNRMVVEKTRQQLTTMKLN